MLAYLRPATLLALALFTVVVADAGAPAYLALAPLAVMLAYRRPATLLALALATVVVADAGAPTLFAPTSSAIVRAFLLRWPRHALLQQTDSHQRQVALLVLRPLADALLNEWQNVACQYSHVNYTQLPLDLHPVLFDVRHCHTDDFDVRHCHTDDEPLLSVPGFVLLLSPTMTATDSRRETRE